MKNINEYIIEAKANADETMFQVCMELENNQDIYKRQLWPLVKSCIKKIDEFDTETLENSSSVNKLITAALKSIGKKIDSENRKTLRKYIVGLILKLMSCETDINKELEDYMIEWDFYNGENKLEW